MISISYKLEKIFLFTTIMTSAALGSITIFMGLAYAQEQQDAELLNNNATSSAEEMAEQDGEGGNIVLEPGEQDPYSPPEPDSMTSVSAQNVDPRLFAEESIEMQDYGTLLEALKLGGFQFTEGGVTYTMEADGSGNKVIIQGTAGVFNQPPQMRIEGIVDDFGWDVDTYAFNPIGELLVELEEAF
jgi:hypothetical protein